MNYFHVQEWPENWITEAIDLICSEWTSHYKPKPLAPLKGKARAADPSTGSRHNVAATVSLSFAQHY